MWEELKIVIKKIEKIEKKNKKAIDKLLQIIKFVNSILPADISITGDECRNLFYIIEKLDKVHSVVKQREIKNLFINRKRGTVEKCHMTIQNAKIKFYDDNFSKFFDPLEKSEVIIDVVNYDAFIEQLTIILNFALKKIESQNQKAQKFLDFVEKLEKIK